MCVCVSQCVHFAGVCSNLSSFSHLLTAGYRYRKIRKALSKFYHRHPDLIGIYNIGFKNSSATPMLGPVFCGDLVPKFKKIVEKPNFSDQFKQIFKRYKKKFGCNMDTRRQCRPNAMISSLIARRLFRSQTQ